VMPVRRFRSRAMATGMSRNICLGTAQEPHLLKTTFCPAVSKPRIEAFVADHNYRRYLESIDNLTLADVYFGLSNHPGRTRKDQTTDHRQSPPAVPAAGCLKPPIRCPRASLILPSPLSQKL